MRLFRLAPVFLCKTPFATALSTVFVASLINFSNSATFSSVADGNNTSANVRTFFDARGDFRLSRLVVRALLLGENGSRDFVLLRFDVELETRDDASGFRRRRREGCSGTCFFLERERERDKYRARDSLPREENPETGVSQREKRG